jgi:cell division protein FtsX
MSHPIPGQPMEAPAQPGPPSSPPDRSARRPRVVLMVVVAVAAMLFGAGTATAAILLLGRDDQPRHRYDVSVFLDHDITAEQRDALEPALAALRPVDGIRFESQEQAYQNFRELFRDQPELIESIEPDTLPESFRLTTTGEVFDCAALRSVRELPGVAEITVVQLPVGDRPGAAVHCP